MKDQILYAFEELSEELPRPPMAALRALLRAGVIPSPKGWQSLPLDVRRALAVEGTRGIVDLRAVRSLLEQVPPRYLKLVSSSFDPDPDQVPASVARSLGPARPLSASAWRAMRAVDRSVLASLAANARLLCRAYDELFGGADKGKQAAVKWTGAIARSELRMLPEALRQLGSRQFLDGRALVLARVAGIRAARKVAEVLDLHSDSAAGPVELDWAIQPQRGSILWQAHVSTWEGAFFPVAALMAVSTASSALYDMIKDLDPGATLTETCIREELWVVGQHASREREEATMYYSGTSARAEPDSHRPLDSWQTPLLRRSSDPGFRADATVSDRAPTLSVETIPVSAPISSGPVGVDSKDGWSGVTARAGASAAAMAAPASVPKTLWVLVLVTVTSLMACLVVVGYVLWSVRLGAH